MKNLLVLVVLGGSLACGPQVDVDDGESVDDEGDDDGDPGERPGPGAMYSACSRQDDCAPLEFCVFPTREGGYCSAACGSGDDISTCSAAPGDGAEVSCLDIGTPDGRTACALDCSDGPCPAMMSCEAIETPSGERRDICF
jgi:hypothetical protein